MSNPQHDDCLELDELDERLTAVERAFTDGDGGGTAASGNADGAALADLRERLDDLESQVTDLDAATQALRGYVGNARSVDRDIERRADAALAKVESLEAQLDGARGQQGDAGDDGRSPGTPPEVDRDGAVATDAPRPDRCDHCGAAHDDGARGPESHHSDRSRRDGPRGSAESENHGSKGRPTRPATGGRRRNRPTADGGRSEWGEPAETAGESRRSRDGGPTAETETSDESGGLFASLRGSL